MSGSKMLGCGVGLAIVLAGGSVDASGRTVPVQRPLGLQVHGSTPQQPDPTPAEQAPPTDATAPAAPAPPPDATAPAAPAPPTDAPQATDPSSASEVPVQAPTSLSTRQSPAGEPIATGDGGTGAVEVGDSPGSEGPNPAPAEDVPVPGGSDRSMPTSSPAPPSGAASHPPSPPGSAAGPRPALEPTLKKKEAGFLDKNFPHKGFTVDFRLGTQGCFGSICRSNHDSSPGFRIGGFLGANIRGWVDVGVSGGWGTLTANVPQGTNALSLFGYDPVAVQQALLGAAGGVVPIDLTALTVSEAKLRTAQVGPHVRVHFIPRGRMTAFIGTGFGYNLFRAHYQTAMGPTTLSFHGLTVPIEAGLGVYVHKNIAVGAQFDYLWTWYGLVGLKHPQRSLVAPLRVLEAMGGASKDMRRELPQFWTLTFSLRVRV